MKTTQHNFDAIVNIDDSYILDNDNIASIHIYQDLYYENENAMSLDSYSNNNGNSGSNINTKSDLYRPKYRDPVMNDLHSRGLDLLFKIRDKVYTTPPPPSPEDTWGNIFPTVLSRLDFLEKYRREESFNFKLPNNFSTRAIEYDVKLPNFAIDYSEYLLGAMIERVADTYELYATMFFLCHSLLDGKKDASGSSASGERVSGEVRNVWKHAMVHFESTKYTSNGIREKPPIFYCNISNNGDGSYYIVEGEFVPNNLTPDSNGNKRTDILRCKMQNTEQAYMLYARTDTLMHIEIIRNEDSLMRFYVPWKTRKTGFMLDEPEGQIVTKFDPWKGFNKNKPGVWEMDNIYMCVPGWEDLPSKAALPLFLEFFQHHFLLGVDHIFTGILLGWKSRHMKTILNIFGSYIDEELLTVTSHAGDGLDGVYR